ncbi:protein FAM160B1 isoform X2 [Strongylocentrotus purpuratus]|uniref:FHF complex subunit HOOK-interacting protein C-terminal domain-containing protein n=1 Tax=Strongylocentrotus purpuratus TaxID=7668 RepID=A0A7M7HIG8_STRPU|nr:protein FAM160B1 isoform X2 [Strongylocentrotus purpuratus]
MFNRFAAVLHQAVEAIAPTQTLLEDFVFHWKAITHYFINNKDDKQPVQDSNIPNHLDNMLVILTQEEGQMEDNQTGPCMEHLLQHKILETLWTLGKADCPPGMKQMVLMFFTNLLGRIKQPLLPHINVYKPVHRLVKVCGGTRAGPTEKEEIQFLCVVCFKLREAPYLANFFLEDPRQSSSRQRGSNRTKPDPSQAEFSVVDSLLKLVQSPDSRIAVKACEGLMLCASLPESQAAQCMVRNTQFCTLLAERLCSLYNALPLSMDPVDIESVEAKWGLDVNSDSDDTNNFGGKRQLISLLSWFDYCDQIIKEGHPIIGKALSTQVKENFLVPIIEQLLLQTSEVGILTSTAHLAKFVKMTSSPQLLNEFVYFILGDNTSPEKPGDADHKIRHRLIERCDHLSDEICIMSLKLFEVLLQKSHVHIVNNLVLRNLKTRSYFDRHPPTPSPPAPASPPLSPSSPGSPPQSPLSPGSHLEADRGETAEESLTVDSDLFLTNGPTSIGADDGENHIPEDDEENHIPEGPLLQGGEGGGTPPVSDQEPDTTNPDSFSDSSLGLDTSRSGLPNSVPQPTSLLPPLSDTPNTNSAISLTTPFDATGATPSLIGVVPLLLSPAPPRGAPTLVSQSSAVTNVPSPLTQLLSSTPDPLSSTMLLGTSPSLSLTSPRSLGSPPGSPTSHGEGGEDTDHNMHRVVSCFLGLIPEENKSSYLTGDTGYDMYLREAHRNFRECTVNSLPYDWPNYPTPLERCPESDPFYEGGFIKILFDKLSRMLDQTYEVNLQVTSLLAKIALFPHPHIHEYLLDPFLNTAPGCRNLHSVLQKVVNDLSVRVRSIPEFQKQLFLVRQQLMGIVEEQDSLPYIDLLEGVIVLEEFCKELAAVAFVKFHAASGR